MVSSEVQRTLVKSPPELWAELSDPDALARHLGALGEIRITAVEPERRVEWEAPNTTGAVAIKASGWGTKVTISVEREIELDEATHDEPVEDTAPGPEGGVDEAAESVVAVEVDIEQDEPSETAAELEPAVDADTASAPEASEPLGEVLPEPEPTLDTDDVAEVEPQLESSESASTSATPAPQPRRGFFARLFRRRERATEHETEAELQSHPADEPDEPAAAAVSPEPQPELAGDSAAPDTPAETPAPITVADFIKPAAQTTREEDEQAPASSAEADDTPDAPELTGEVEQEQPVRDVAEELRIAEEAATEEVTAMLTAVLDRLGAAHHRPFSRS